VQPTSYELVEDEEVDEAGMKTMTLKVGDK